MTDEESRIDLKKRLAGVGIEVGSGIGTDLLTGALLNPLTLKATAGLSGLAYGAINFGQGAYTNYLVQKHLYGEENVNWGEILASGATSVIPFMNIGASKGVSKFVGKAGSLQRGLVGGAGTAIAGEQLRVGIDENRFLTPGETVMAGALGGTLGGVAGQTSKYLKVRKAKATLDDIARRRMPTTKFAQEATMMMKQGTGKKVIASSTQPARNAFDPRVTGKIKTFKDKLNANAAVQRFTEDIPSKLDEQAVTNDAINTAITESIHDIPAYRSTVPGGPEVFDYDIFKDFISGVRIAGYTNITGRNYLEMFQSGFTPGGAGKGVNFGTFSTREVRRLREVFGPSFEALGLSRNAAQVHHMAALKSIMGIHDGLGLGSSLYNQVNDTIMAQLKPVTRRGRVVGTGLGNQETNLLGVISGSRIYNGTSISDTPHVLAHRFLTSRIGGAGEKFFTPTVRRNMKNSKSYRIKKAKELGKMIQEANEIVIQAQDVYETLFAQGTGIDFGEIMRVMLQLDDAGYLPTISRNYQTSAVAEIIEEINAVLELQQFTLQGRNLGTVDMLGLFDPSDYKAKALKEALKSGGTISENHRALKAVLGKYYDDTGTTQLTFFDDEQISDFVAEFKLYKKQKKIEAKSRKNQKKYFEDPDVYKNLLIDE